MTANALPSQARLSRRGRARLRRAEPATLVLIPGRDQEAADPPFDPPDIDDLLGEHEDEAHEDVGPLVLTDVAHYATTPAPVSADDDADVLVDMEAAPVPDTTPAEPVTGIPDTEALRAFAPSAMRAEPNPAQIEPATERRGQYQPPANSALKPIPRRDDVEEAPVPPIDIYISWDRPDVLEQHLTPFAADKHLARADITTERGGMESAIAHCRTHSPDLLIIDTTLGATAMLEALDQLTAIIAPTTKLIIIGAINDVPLLRALAGRGVAEYIVPPARRNDLVRAACRLFSDAAKAHVVAVIGARGGVGASTLAQNLAWTFAERQGARTTLIDLDLPFGGAAFALGDAAIAPGEALSGDCAFTRSSVTRAQRLDIVHLNEAFKHGGQCDEAQLDTLLKATKRLSSFVVLDLPHDWNAWVKRALASADSALIVSSPDLASLRTAEGMLRQLKTGAPRLHPMVVLSMVGMRARCEIPRKDFLQALNTECVLDLEFDPALFGLAALKGQMLAEAAPRAKPTTEIEALASKLTGRPCLPRKAAQAPETLNVKPKPTTKRTKSSEPDIITYPLTFLQPGVAPATATRVAAAGASLEAVRAKALPQSPTRRALRIAAMAALLLQASSWTLQAQPGGSASALEPVRATPAHRPPAAAANQSAAQTPTSGGAAEHFELAQRLRDTPDAALPWLHRAAAGGHCEAMYELGLAYARGEGVPRDDATAFGWFKQAAELGLVDAQYNLALLYQQGAGVAASSSEALFWFLRAAQAEDAAAEERAAMLAAFMPISEVEHTRARAHATQMSSTPNSCLSSAPDAQQ